MKSKVVESECRAKRDKKDKIYWDVRREFDEGDVLSKRE